MGRMHSNFAAKNCNFRSYYFESFPIQVFSFLYWVYAYRCQWVVCTQILLRKTVIGGNINLHRFLFETFHFCMGWLRLVGSIKL